MEELIRSYKSEVQDPEQFERLCSNGLFQEIEDAVTWVIDAIESDLDVDLSKYVSGDVTKEYLKEYLAERSDQIGMEDPWFTQKVLR